MNPCFEIDKRDFALTLRMIVRNLITHGNEETRKIEERMSNVMKLIQNKTRVGELICPKTWRKEIKIRTEEFDVAEKIMLFRESMAKEGEEIKMMSWLITDGEIENEVVSRNSPFYLKYQKEIKYGQKLGRALFALIKARNGEEMANMVVSRVFSQCKPSDNGTLVISANPIDIITSSECATFRSCHSLDKEKRLGSIQYSVDSATMVAFFYKKTADYGAIQEFPFKVWRQIIMLDFENRAAVFLREYGWRISEKITDVLQQEVQNILQKIDVAQSDEWHTCYVESEDEISFEYEGNHIVYIDNPQQVIKPVNKRWLTIKNSQHLLCPSCMLAVTPDDNTQKKWLCDHCIASIENKAD